MPVTPNLTSQVPHPQNSGLVRATDSQTCCTSEWEAAYLRFETPEEEVQKFTKRLRRLGAARWPRDARIVELFCGRGNGLVALERLGFQNLSGVDLSAALLDRYNGTAKRVVADCRQMPFAAASQDVLIVQGGLHHVAVLPDDLQQVLAEARRVLTPEGLFVAVEPWRTPFLDFVHAACKIKLLRRAWPRLDACATMIDHEIDTYTNWLSRPKEILDLFRSHFWQTYLHIRWGKIYFAGKNEAIPANTTVSNSTSEI